MDKSIYDVVKIGFSTLGPMQLKLPDTLPDAKPHALSLHFASSQKSIKGDTIFKQAHHLAKQMQHTSWHNIPLGLKEIISSLVDHAIDQEHASLQEKIRTNERCFELQLKTKEVFDDLVLAIVEARYNALSQ